MKVTIHAHHLALPPDLTTFLTRKVIRPLTRLYDDPAASLDVHLGDERPRKGGVDQACGLSYRMPGARTIRVESTQDDLHKALLDASDRLKRHVRRQLDRMRSSSRKPVHRPLGRTWRERSTRRGTTPGGDPSTL